MRLHLLTLLSMMAGCSAVPPKTDGGSGGGKTDGGGGGSQGSFLIVDLDPAARENTYLATAVDATSGRIGVVYYAPLGTQTMSGHFDYALKYLEYKNGVASAPETIRTVQRLVGLAIAFHPTTGEPTVGFLGGNQGFVVGQSIFWFQSDASLAVRNNGTWTETVVAVSGDRVMCPSPLLSDRGFLVGLWPALAYDSAGVLHYAYRDSHDGQFGTQDYKASDVEAWSGTAVGSMTGKCVKGGGDDKGGFGGHISMVMANGQPVVVHDSLSLSADGVGTNAYFQKRNADGSWTPVVTVWVGASQSAPSLSFDSISGYGIAVTEASTLKYLSSSDGATWSVPDPVVGDGSGGWFPSLAFDPVNHEPAIAYYNCSRRTGVNEASCTTEEDELHVRQLIGQEWKDTLVDAAGGVNIHLAFLANGKRLIVYRVPLALGPDGMPTANSGAIKLAIEK
jgi:hypothetical protein